MIRAVVFDLDETLLDHSVGERQAVEAIRVDLDPPPEVSSDDLASLWHSEMERHMRRYLAGELTFAEQRSARVRSVFVSLGKPDPSAETVRAILSKYVAAFEAGWRLFPDVLPCLRSLSAYPLGLVTNGESEQQRLKLTRMGLTPYFSSVVISGEIGVTKPDPAIFAVVLRGLGVAAEESVHVGDNWEADVVGARNAGIQGVWLNRRHELRGEAHSNVTVIHSLSSLPGLIGTGAVRTKSRAGG